MSQKYRDSGVDLDVGREFVRRIKPLAKKTANPGVMDSIGGFSGAFDLSLFDFKDPVLVAGTDGVGTKLKLAALLDQHDGIGIDLVAMSVNDVIVCGGRPLFFLDYYAQGKLDLELGTKLIEGIVKGCQMSGCALLGGETAEMPGLYHGNDYDLAGFCVGAVERGDRIDGSRVKPGDVILGLASSGPHSNGYSLIRKLVTRADGSLNQDLFQNGSHQYLHQIMEPTRIYVKPILNLQRHVSIHGMAHITGGGFFENIPRCLPPGTHAVVERKHLRIPPLFQWLMELGKMDNTEPYHVWNMGVGFVVVLSPSDAKRAQELLLDSGIPSTMIGQIEKAQSSQSEPVVVFE